MRNTRFLITMSEELNIEAFFVNSFTRPTVTINEIIIKDSNNNEYHVKLGSEQTWDDIEMQFRETDCEITDDKLLKLIKIWYDKNESNKLFRQIKNELNIKVQSIDPTGVVVEEWELFVEIKEVILNNSLNDCYLTLKPLHVQLNF